MSAKSCGKVPYILNWFWLTIQANVQPWKGVHSLEQADEVHLLVWCRTKTVHSEHIHLCFFFFLCVKKTTCSQTKDFALRKIHIFWKINWIENLTLSWQAKEALDWVVRGNQERSYFLDGLGIWRSRWANYTVVFSDLDLKKTTKKQFACSHTRS